MLAQYRGSLQDPDDIWIRGSEARKRFAVTSAHLRELGTNYILKESPYDADQEPFRQYPLKDVVALALKKHGEQFLLDHYNRMLTRHAGRDRDIARKLYGNFEKAEEEQAEAQGGSSTSLQKRVRYKRYWYNSPSTTTTEGWESVMQGLKSNTGICLAKGAVWFGTGSHVMFADWMHSIADVANYSYRLIELNRSARHRDLEHPYGYAPLRYITADRSFVFLGFVGGVCPLISGVKELAEAAGAPVKLGEHLIAPAVVIVMSALLEGAAVGAATREILSQHRREKIGSPAGPDARGFMADLRRVFQYLREGRDVMSTATFAEASSGVIGAGVGLVGIGASWWLESGTPDVVASIVMASMVCGLSSFLLRKSGTALLGQTLPQWRVKVLVSLLESQPAIVNVYDVKTEMVGTDTVRFKAEVQFNPQAITERILYTMSQSGRLISSEEDEKTGSSHKARLAHTVLAQRLQDILPQLHHGTGKEQRPGVSESDPSAAWLFRNNSLFYEALAWELKEAEHELRNELQDFKNVHIDLEPW